MQKKLHFLLFLTFFSVQISKACLVTPSFTYSVTRTCGIPNIIRLTNTSTGTSNNRVTYFWRINNQIIDSTYGLDSVNFLLKRHGNNSIKLLVRDSLGCIDSSSNVTVNVTSNAPNIEDQVNGFNKNPVWMNCIQFIDDLDTFRIFVSSQDTLRKLKIFWGDGSFDTTGANLPPNTSISHLYTANGSFTYKVVTQNGSCIDTIYGTVYNQRQPTAGIIGPPSGGNRGCVPFTLRIVNNSYNISNLTNFIVRWGEGDSSLLNYTSVGDTIYHVYRRGVCNGTITLIAQNVCGSSTATWNPIDVSDRDVALWSVTNTCDPTQDLVFVNNSRDRYCLNPDIKEYFWDFGDGTTVGWTTSRADQRKRYAVEGDYVVTLLVRNGCGIDTYRNTVPVYYNPRPGFILNTNRGCAPVTISAADTSKGRGITRTWFISGQSGYSTTDSILNHTFNTPGTYTVRVTATNRCASVNRSQTVVVNGKPTSRFGSIGNGCTPHTVSFNNTSTSYFNNPTYNWDFGDNTNSNQRNPSNKVYTTPGNYSIRLIVSDTCGNDTFIRSFTVYALPVASYEHDTVYCSFDSLNVVNNSSNSSQYLWNFGNGNSFSASNANPFKVVYNSAGQYTSQLIAISPAGCRDTATLPIRIKPGALAQFDLDKPFACAPASFNVTNRSIYAQDYQWYANNSLISNADTVPLVNINSDSSIIRLKLIVTSASSCLGDSITKIIFTPKNPESIIGNLDSGCGPLTVQFVNNSLFNTRSFWEFNNGSTSNIRNPSTTFQPALSRDSVYNIKLKTWNWLGCADSVQSIVKVYPKPTAEFSMNLSEGCGPLLVNFTNNSVTNNNDPFNSLNFDWIFGNSSTSNNTNPSSTYQPNNLKDSVYFAKLIVTSLNSCKDSITKNIKVYPIPYSEISPDKTSGCQLLEVNFNNLSNPKDTGNINMMSFIWNDGNGNTSYNQNFTTIYPASQYRDTVYRVKLTSTSEHGCVDSSFVNITVHPDPKAQFTLNTNAGCTPLNIFTQNNSQSFDGGALQNQWDFGNSFYSISENDTVIQTNNTNNNITRTIRLIVTSQYQCKDTVSHDITIYPKPVVSFNNSVDRGCAPINFVSTDNSINANTYFWGTKDVSYQGNLVQPMMLPGIPLFDTTYVIAHSVSSIYGCLSDTMYRSIIVYGRPVASITYLNDSMCSRETVNVLNSSLGGFQYAWNFGDGTTSSQVNPRKRYNVIQNGRDTIFNVNLIVTSAAGCKDTSNKPVYLIPRPTETIVLDKSFGCTDLEINAHHISNRFRTLYWEMGDNSSDKYSDSITHIYNNINNYSIQRSLKLHRQRFNCRDTAQTLITVLPKPQADLVYRRLNLCDNGNYQFLDRSFNAAEFLWSFSDGTNYSVPSLNKTLPASTNSDSFYYVKLKVKNIYGCQDSTEQLVRVKAKQVIKFNKFPLSSCERGQVNFTNLSTNSIRFLWKFGDGNISTEVHPNYVYNNHGYYQIQLFGYDKDGCVDSSDGNEFFSVIERPKADFDFLPQLPKLPNADVNFVNKTRASTVNVRDLYYEWDFGEGKPVSNDYSDFNYEYTTAGEKLITLRAYNKQCMSEISKPIFIDYHRPEIKFEADVYEGCAPLSVKFKNETTYANTYQWIYSDGSLDDFAFEPTHVFRHPGKFSVTLRATGPGGTTIFEKQYIITVHPTPFVDFVSVRQAMIMPNARFRMENRTTGADTFNWIVTNSSNQNIITSSLLRDPTFEINEPGNFSIKLIAKNQKGCSDTLEKIDYLTVIRQGNVYVPSAFSPNKNNVNDEFIPVYMNVKYTNFRFSIYNRWGERIFETTDRDKGWNGKYMDEDCQQEVYVWIVEGEYEGGESFMFRGTVTLLR